MTPEDTPRTEGRWTDPDGREWAYQLAWGTVEGRLECVGIELTSQGQTLTVSRLTAELLRRFPLGRLIDEGRRQQDWWMPQEQELFRQLLRKAEEAGGSGRLTPRHLAEVAMVYTKAHLAGEPPTKAVQEWWKWGPVPYGTAARWVTRCRQLGLLEPTEKGRGGGVPQPHGGS
jgi:hypothetical protein